MISGPARGLHRRVLALLALMIPVAIEAVAQEETLVGSVVAESRPVAGTPVTLHRVTPSASGPVVTRETDSAGRFRFTIPPADTSRFNVYFTTVEYLGVRYFGAPIHPGEVQPAYSIEVFDTVSGPGAAGAIKVARRDLIVLPEGDLGWTVNEIVRVVNTGQRTVVSAGGMPTWEATVPEGAVDLEASEGQVAAADVQLMGNRVLYMGSLLPGAREIILRYRLPDTLREAALRFGSPTDTANLYVRQPAPDLEVEGLESRGEITFQGESFVRYGGSDLPADARIDLAWSQLSSPIDPVLAGVAAAVLVLLVGVWAAVRGSRDRAAAHTAHRTGAVG